MLRVILKIKALIGKSTIEEEPAFVISNEQLRIECRVEYFDGHYHFTLVDLLTKIEWKLWSRALDRDKAIEKARRMVLLSPTEVRELSSKVSSKVA